MYLPPFEYVRPADVTEALDILADRGDDASVYMGGTELLLLMKLGLAAPGCLVDCKRIDGLADIGVNGGWLTIGSAVTHRQVEISTTIRQLVPELTNLTAGIGNVRVRAAGTLGGNLCFADPHSDPATLLIALGAVLHVAAADGRRDVDCAEFAVGPYETVLEVGELLVGLSIPLPAQDTAIAYERIGFRERPILNVAIARIGAEFRVVVAGGGRRARRLAEVESGLARVAAGQQVIEYGVESVATELRDLAQLTAESLDPAEDLDGSAAYKRQLMRVAFRRAVVRAFG
ncbi:MAG TPA: FAD binding domain-containing protein [Jatrophihabitans sp.]|nr:FAD binding domain-containing protein [Jatrophihabitans sp.]